MITKNNRTRFRTADGYVLFRNFPKTHWKWIEKRYLRGFYCRWSQIPHRRPFLKDPVQNLLLRASELSSSSGVFKINLISTFRFYWNVAISEQYSRRWCWSSTYFQFMFYVIQENSWPQGVQRMFSKVIFGNDDLEYSRVAKLSMFRALFAKLTFFLDTLKDALLVMHCSMRWCN